MSRFNRNPSPAYRAFVEEIQEYAEANQEPGEGVRRAIADALEDDLHGRFKGAWNADDTADTACFRRLITGFYSVETPTRETLSHIRIQQ